MVRPMGMRKGFCFMYLCTCSKKLYYCFCTGYYNELTLSLYPCCTARILWSPPASFKALQSYSGAGLRRMSRNLPCLSFFWWRGPQQNSPLPVCASLRAHVDAFPEVHSISVKRAHPEWPDCAQVPLHRTSGPMEEPGSCARLCHMGKGLSGLNPSIVQGCHMGDRSEVSEHVSAALSACLPPESPLPEIPHSPWFAQRELGTANACLICVKQTYFVFLMVLSGCHMWQENTGRRNLAFEINEAS